MENKQEPQEEHHWIFVNGKCVFNKDRTAESTDPWQVAKDHAQDPESHEVRHIVKKRAGAGSSRWEEPTSG